jgi:hypothetical protein
MKTQQAKYQEIIIDVDRRDKGSVAAWTCRQACRSVLWWPRHAPVKLTRSSTQPTSNGGTMTTQSRRLVPRPKPWGPPSLEGFPNAFTVGLSVAEQHPQDRRVWPFVNALYAQQVDKTQRFVSRGFTIRAYINWKIR